MSKGPVIPYHASTLGSLGVEIEWMTVDCNSGAQVPAAPALLEAVDHYPRIKPELFTSTIEINSGIHQHTSSCIEELQQLSCEVGRALADQNAALLAGGTHPFSHWQDQVISDDARYQRLVERLQWMARRFNIFGIHVHVGMPDGDSCINAMNNLMPVIPAFLAISANSPFWGGHDTGLAACRIKIFEGLSQGGMPFYFEDWQDFEHCANRLIATNSIDSVRDIWWEMRPHPDFGTLEIRIGDMLPNMADTKAYVAFVRAEAVAAARYATTTHVHPSLIRENRWRACRYGMQAMIIDPEKEEVIPVLDWIEMRLDRLAGQGAGDEDIDIVRKRLPIWRRLGDGASRQRALRAKYTSDADMIRAMRADDWQHDHDL